MMDELVNRQVALAAVKDALMAWSYMPEWRDEKIIEAIAELPSTQPHWIPCSERLPDEECDYLVTDDTGGVKTVEVDTLLHYKDDGKPFWCYSQNAIAWRELPALFGEE